MGAASLIGDRLLDRWLIRRHGWAGDRINAQRRSLAETMFRDRARPVYVGNGSVLCTALGRYRMYVEGNDGSISAHLIAGGVWELWVVEVLAELLRRRMTVVDVGANLGFFTLVMADFCQGGAVHAFEPNPLLANYLRRNLAVNGYADRVTVHQAAVGDDETRTLHLVVPDGLLGGGHLVERDAVAGRNSTELPLVRLDRVEGARDAQIVKIDAEGAEPLIWRGMEAMLRGTTLSTVLLEFAPVRYHDPAAFLAEILEAGFALSYVHEAKGVLPTNPGAILADRARMEWMLLLRR